MGGLFLGEFEIAPVDVDAYFARIGYSGSREPSLSTLKELHRLQPAHIPFESIDVRLGLGIDLAPAAVDAKLIGSRRGGYCFELNSLFYRVLLTLGFQVDALIARSRWRRPLNELVARTHMAMRVKLEEGDWLADVGFGACMLTAPLRMDVEGIQRTQHEPARLRLVDGELRHERLLGDEWAPIFDVVLAPQKFVDMVSANWLISNHPASTFRQHLVVSRTQDDVRHMLVDTRLTVRRRDATVQHTELTACQIEQCLQDDFGLTVQDDWRPLFAELASHRSN